MEENQCVARLPRLGLTAEEFNAQTQRNREEADRQAKEALIAAMNRPRADRLSSAGNKK